MVDRYGVRLREVDGITNRLTRLHHRRNRSNVVVILQCRNNCLQSRNIGIHLVAKDLQLLKRIPSRYFYLSSIRKSENHIILIRIVHIGKHRVTNKTCIAFVTLIALVSFISLISLISGSFAKLIPSFTIVVRNVPIVVLDFELRGNSILAIFSVSTISSVCAVSSVLTILTILTIGTICTVCAICAILAVGTLGLNFVAIIVKQPLAVECPIVDTI